MPTSAAEHGRESTSGALEPSALSTAGTLGLGVLPHTGKKWHWLLPVSAQEPDEEQQRTNKTEDERSTELSGERLLGPRAGAARLSLQSA
jgi:hypothetical protein